MSLCSRRCVEGQKSGKSQRKHNEGRMLAATKTASWNAVSTLAPSRKALVRCVRTRSLRDDTREKEKEKRENTRSARKPGHRTSREELAIRQRKIDSWAVVGFCARLRHRILA